MSGTEEIFQVSLQQETRWARIDDRRRTTIGIRALGSTPSSEELRRAIDTVVMTNEILRTSFVEHGEARSLGQRIDQQCRYENADLPDTDHNPVGELLGRLRAFDPDPVGGPAAFFASVSATGQFWIGAAISALCCDLRSIDLVLGEIARHSDAGTSKADLSVQYADYSAWQRELAVHSSDSADLTTAPPLWKTDLSKSQDVIEAELPTGELLADLEDDTMLSASEYLETIWAILVGRTFEVGLISVIRIEDGRGEPELASAIGCYEQDRLVAYRLASDQSLASCCGATGSILYASRKLPLPAFRYVDFSRSGSMIVEDLFTRAGVCMDVQRHSRMWRVRLHFDPQLLPRSEAQRWLERFQVLSAGALEHPEEALADLPWLGPVEATRLRELVGQIPPYPCRTVLSDLRSVAAVRPTSVAVYEPKRSVTFAQLDAMSHAVACNIASRVGTGALVGLFIERSAELIAAIFGTLKAGCAYVPIDPAYPVVHVAKLLANSKINLLIGNKASLNGFGTVAAADVLSLDEAQNLPARSPALPDVSPSELAYVIFTSGSTGQPKGVMVEHGSLFHLLDGLEQCVYHDDPDRCMRIAVNGSVAFDTSVKQIFQVTRGRPLVLFPEDMRREHQLLFDHLVRYGADCIDCTPSQLRLWVSEGLLDSPGLSLRKILVGGEEIRPALWQALAGRKKVDFFNLYGPTECTVDTTFCRIDQSTSDPTIGRPLPGARVEIRNKRLELCGIGEEGEIVVGGNGLARGYLDDNALTQAKFINLNGIRSYLTGDNGRWRQDGTIVYLGRRDRQVKVRGHRVELGEVEARLSGLHGVQEAISLLAEDGHLVAFLSLAAGTLAPTSASLQAAARDLLPDFMVPARFRIIGTRPLTRNGKTDYQQLLALDVELGSGSVAGSASNQRLEDEPRTELQKLLAQIWQEVLGVERIGIRDGFFELGGDSIMCIQVVARAKRRGLRFKVSKLFSHQTILALSEDLQSEVMLARAPSEVAGTLGAVPLTPIQARFFERALEDAAHWNQSMLLQLKRPIEPRRLRNALRKLITQHEAFRCRYHRDGAEWRQHIVPPSEIQVGFDLRVVELGSNAPAERQAVIIDETRSSQASLNLADGPLLCAVQFRTDHCGFLYLAAHHLAVDGVSWRIILDDLEHLLTMEPGASYTRIEDSTSFSKWARALQDLASEPRFAEHFDHWLRESGSPATRLPVQHPEIANDLGELHTVAIELDVAETARVFEHLARSGLNPEDLLLASLLRAIRDEFGLPAITIDIEGHGRDASIVERNSSQEFDLSQTVGWFTAIYPATFDLSQFDSAEEGLLAVKRKRLSLSPIGSQFGLIKYLTPVGEPLRASPSASVSFNYFGKVDSHLKGSQLFEYSNLKTAPQWTNHGRQLYELELNSAIRGDALRINLTVHRARVALPTWERLADRMRLHLFDIAKKLAGARLGFLSMADFSLVALTSPALKAVQSRFTQYEDVLPVTPVQSAMLARLSTLPYPGQYTFSICADFAKPLDFLTFYDAVEACTERNQALRTAYVRAVDQSWAQVSLVSSKTILRSLTWRDVPQDRFSDEVGELLASERARPLPIYEGVPARWLIIERPDGGSTLLVTFSVVALDLSSFFLVFNQLWEDYQARLTSRAAALSNLRSSADYLRYLATEISRSAVSLHWRKALAGWRESARLVPDYRIGQSSVAEMYREISATLPSELADNARQVAKRTGVTLNTMLQVAWARMVADEHDQHDILLGVTTSGRPADVAGADRMLGRFLNTLPLRIDVTEFARIDDLIREVQRRQAMLIEHDTISLDEIRGMLGLTSESPVFEVNMVFEGAAFSSSEWERIGIVGAPLFCGPAEAPIKLEVLADWDGKFEIMLSYLPAWLDQSRADCLLCGFIEHIRVACDQLKTQTAMAEA